MPEITLHPLLQYSHHDVEVGHCCSIIWDLREPPARFARPVSAPDRYLSEIELSQPATSPAVLKLQITCGIFPQDWPIEAHNQQGVTIRDVLEAIFTTVTAQLQQQEWDQLAAKQQDRVGKIFEARWKASTDPRVYAFGVARVDCLLYHIWFAGLTVSSEGEDTCFMSLRRPK